MPHLDVPDIRAIDWQALKVHTRGNTSLPLNVQCALHGVCSTHPTQAIGFKGCIFDKDNTLTAPYVPTVAPHLAAALQACKSAFGDSIVVYSNSAGLAQFDPQGKRCDTHTHQVDVFFTLRTQLGCWPRCPHRC